MIGILLTNKQLIMSELERLRHFYSMLAKVRLEKSLTIHDIITLKGKFESDRKYGFTSYYIGAGQWITIKEYNPFRNLID